ncbi:MAG: response regulator [Ichthyobacteriaceae bacterium]|nr:response regulator [Ichthyobacteriaceae bacterium]
MVMLFFVVKNNTFQKDEVENSELKYYDNLYSELSRIKHSTATDKDSVFIKTCLAGVEKYKKEGDINKVMELFLSLGKYEHRIKEYNDALYFFKKAKEISLHLNLDRSIGRIEHKIGLVYFDIKDYNMALVSFKNAFKLYERAKDIKSTAWIANGIGKIYVDLKEFDKAKKYFNIAYEKTLITKDIYGTAYTLHKYSRAESLSGNHKQSLSASFKALNIVSSIKNKKSNDFKLLVLIYKDISKNYTELGDYEKALDYVNKAIECKEKHQGASKFNCVYTAQALAFNESGNYSMALKSMNTFDDMMGVSRGIIEDEVNSKWAYYLIYKNLKNYKKSLQYLTEYNEIKDSLTKSFSNASLQQIITLNKVSSKYLKREIENKELQTKLFEQSLQRKFLYAIIFIFIAILIVGVYSFFKIFKLNKKLNSAYIKAKNADKSKSSFLANMSHEIRTPMNGIIGMTELLKNTSLDTTQKDYLSLIDISSNNLLVIINDILDFSKIEANKLGIETSVFDVEQVFHQSSVLISVKAEKKGIDVITDFDPQISSYLINDEIRLKQVLLNLANNAVKFTMQGSVVMKAELLDETEEFQMVKISVIDSGIGISEEEEEHLFKPFTQADVSTTRKFGGTGLGLAISSEIVKMLGGKLKVKSKVNEGSEFYFTLKFKKDNSKLNFSYKGELQNVNIVVVDDNSVRINAVAKYLKYFGANVITANTELDLINKLDINNNTDLLIVNDKIESLNGTDLIANLKHKLPVSAKTILVLPQSKCVDPLFNSDYMRMPLGKNYLYKHVKNVLEGNNTELSKADDSVGVLSERIKILLVEDNIINQKVAKLSLEKLGHEVDVANNGKIGVEMYLENRYNLILMDVQMPVMNGIEATKLIREVELEMGVAKTYIVAVTAGAMKDDLDKAINAGVDEYISKPFSNKQLVSAVNNAVNSTCNNLVVDFGVDY